MIRISWSRMLAFKTCQRKFELGDLEGLEAIPNEESFNLLFGTAIHAGIHSYLVTSEMRVARQNAHTALDEATPQNAVKYNPLSKKTEVNHDFYAGVQALHMKVDEVLNYYLPRLGIGDTYRVAMQSEVFGEPKDWAEQGKPDPNTIPMLEWKFEIPLGISDDPFPGPVLLTGVIDAVLVDKESGELVLVDWKTRKSFDERMSSELDGQLHLYAWVLRHLGANIQRVAMVEMRTQTPKPAELSTDKKKQGWPLTGKASYDTTEEYWIKTLPMGIDPYKFLPQMQGKFKQDSDFIRWVEMPVTDTSNVMAEGDLKATIRAMIFAAEQNKLGYQLPAALGSHACKFCDFRRLCVSPLRYGGDIAALVGTHYQYKEQVDKRDEL